MLGACRRDSCTESEKHVPGPQVSQGDNGVALGVPRQRARFAGFEPTARAAHVRVHDSSAGHGCNRDFTTGLEVTQPAQASKTLEEVGVPCFPGRERLAEITRNE